MDDDNLPQYSVEEMNLEVLEKISTFLRERAGLITEEMMEELTGSSLLSREQAYLLFVVAACGMDIDNSVHDRLLYDRYFRHSVKEMEPGQYRENLYYRNIHIEYARHEDWELKKLQYLPYEAFIYDDIIVEADGREIPRIGFFSEGFTYPAVLEAEREWMTVTPLEINTMKPVIDAVHGDVITFGLGLGYFAYMASEKPDVHSVTVIERDAKIISLFKKVILPQFSYGEKIRIITADAFEYLEGQMTGADAVFVDLWHDVSDGYNIYERMKNLQGLHKNTKFYYWIEDSLKSHERFLKSCQNEVANPVKGQI